MPASRRLFWDVAEEIRRTYDLAEESDKPIIRDITRKLAVAFKRDNIHFKREKFLSVALGSEWSDS